MCHFPPVGPANACPGHQQCNRAICRDATCPGRCAYSPNVCARYPFPLPPPQPMPIGPYPAPAAVPMGPAPPPGYGPAPQPGYGAAPQPGYGPAPMPVYGPPPQPMYGPVPNPYGSPYPVAYGPAPQQEAPPSYSAAGAQPNAKGVAGAAGAGALGGLGLAMLPFGILGGVIDSVAKLGGAGVDALHKTTDEALTVTGLAGLVGPGVHELGDSLFNAAKLGTQAVGGIGQALPAFHQHPHLDDPNIFGNRKYYA
ncbi:hypothetical protein MKEN_00235000 [Mycena kentingensis (nom. inval.)]|nr:hypothetical protein MKEN_00235000 [Mycena kentingensis (nom. inval.)]